MTFEALKRDGWQGFAANELPKCPHCGEDFDIREEEAWFLYDEEVGYDMTFAQYEQPLPQSAIDL